MIGSSFLKLLPEDLSFKEDSYQASLVYQEYVAQYANIWSLTGDQDFASLSLWELTLARIDDDELVLRGPIERPSSREVMGLCAVTNRLIDDSCAGLLEIHSKDMGDDIDTMTLSKITYLHRTVRDWWVNGKFYSFKSLLSSAGLFHILKSGIM